MWWLLENKQTPIPTPLQKNPQQTINKQTDPAPIKDQEKQQH